MVPAAIACLAITGNITRGGAVLVVIGPLLSQFTHNLSRVFACSVSLDDVL